TVARLLRPSTRMVALLDMESAAAVRARRISAFLSIKYWSTGAIFGYLFDCAAAFGTRTPMLITSTKAMILIILSLVAALIARYPFAVAARSPSSSRSNPQPAVSQALHTSYLDPVT